MIEDDRDFGPDPNEEDDREVVLCFLCGDLSFDDVCGRCCEGAGL